MFQLVSVRFTDLFKNILFYKLLSKETWVFSTVKLHSWVPFTISAMHLEPIKVVMPISILLRANSRLFIYVRKLGSNYPIKKQLPNYLHLLFIRRGFR